MRTTCQVPVSNFILTIIKAGSWQKGRGGGWQQKIGGFHSSWWVLILFLPVLYVVIASSQNRQVQLTYLTKNTMRVQC